MYCTIDILVLKDRVERRKICSECTRSVSLSTHLYEGIKRKPFVFVLLRNNLKRKNVIRSKRRILSLYTVFYKIIKAFSSYLDLWNQIIYFGLSGEQILPLNTWLAGTIVRIRMSDLLKWIYSTAGPVRARLVCSKYLYTIMRAVWKIIHGIIRIALWDSQK